VAAAVAAGGSGDVGGGGIDSGDVGGRGSASGDVGSSGRGGGGGGSGRGGGGGSGRGGGGGGDSKRRTMRPSFPFSSLEALAKESIQKKEKAEKVYFYLRQQLSRNTNLDPIFSESRSGTIANKNIKRITAVTQLEAT
jgi:hypothetical protein